MLLFETYIEELSPQTKEKLKKAAKIGAGILGAGAAIAGAAYAAKHHLQNKNDEIKPPPKEEHLIGSKMLPNINPEDAETYDRVNRLYKVYGNQVVFDPTDNSGPFKLIPKEDDDGMIKLQYMKLNPADKIKIK